MTKFDAHAFINKVLEQMPGSRVPHCPYCGGDEFTSLPQQASILISDDLDGIDLGPNVPAGMLICTKCGYISFFSLGVLGMLPSGGADGNGE